MDKLKEIVDTLQKYKENKQDSTGEYDTPSITIFSDGSGHVDLGDVEETSESFYSHGDLEAAMEMALEIAQKITKINPTVDLNGSYSAEVTENGIEVGCQKISFASFDKLAEVVAKVRPAAVEKKANKVGDVVSFDGWQIGERAKYCGVTATKDKRGYGDVYTRIADTTIRNSYGEDSQYTYRDTFWEICK
jgi:hypothetical protein